MTTPVARWEERVEELVRAAAEGRPGPRTLWFHAGGGCGLADVVAAAGQAAGRSGGTSLEVPCAPGGLDPLVPLRALLVGLLPTIHAEAGPLVQRLGAELAAVHPPLLERLSGAAPRPLDEIANTPSERRSHRESEQLFRIANGLGQLVHGALDECPSFKSGALVLCWTDLHLADPATLLTFRRLSRWARHAQSRLVLVATLDPEGCPPLAAPDLPPAAATLFDWRPVHRELLALVRSQSLGEPVAAGGWPDRTAGDRREPTGGGQRRRTAGGEPAHTAGGRPGDQATGPEAGPAAGPLPAADPDPSPVSHALSLLVHGRTAEGCAAAIRAMVPATFTLDYEAVLALAGAVVAACQAGGDPQVGSRRRAGSDPFDEAEFDRVWRATEPARHYAALEFSVRPPAGRVGVLTAAWHAAGFANSCLQRHETALDCYRHSLAIAQTRVQRARSLMYLGLITGKRLHRHAEAEAHIRAGLAELDGATSPEEVLESGWLLNVNALMAYSTGRPDEAMRMVRKAWRRVRGLQSSEATHLKVNLISNITVLLEHTDRAAEAVTMWENFGTVLRRANELFAKHYYYREGGLRLRAGRPEDAFSSYQASFAQCLATADPLHGSDVAQACGTLAYQLADLPEAARWYGQAAEQARLAGDHETLARVLATRAFLLARAGDREEPPVLLAEAQQLADRLRASADQAAGRRSGQAGEPARLDSVPAGVVAAIAAVAGWWRQPADDRLATVERLALATPRTKLNRPFRLTNTYESAERP